MLCFWKTYPDWTLALGAYRMRRLASDAGMRLWSLHPKYLDPKGLVALWREALLAQAVLRGETKGYRNHPQLQRFRSQKSPRACIAEYLRAVHLESFERGYHFDERKITRQGTSARISVTRGQLEFEWCHLLAKLEARAPTWREQCLQTDSPSPHPLFRVNPGVIEEWERP